MLKHGRLYAASEMKTLLSEHGDFPAPFYREWAQPAIFCMFCQHGLYIGKKHFRGAKCWRWEEVRGADSLLKQWQTAHPAAILPGEGQSFRSVNPR
jgi:hypothetical protein